MAAPKFSNWFLVRDGREIDEAHLPAAYWQYRWYLDTEFDLPAGWGTNGGIMRCDFELALGDVFGSKDLLNLVCATQSDFFGGATFWTYYPGTMRMTPTGSVETWAGADPYWEYAGPTSDYTDGTGFVNGWFTSPIYHLTLPRGTVVDIKRYRFSDNIPGGVSLQMRTALGASGRKRQLIDPVSADKHLPRVTDGMLLVRTKQSVDGRLTGILSGLTVTKRATSGGQAEVAVSSGTAIVAYVEVECAKQTVSVPTSGTWYIVVDQAGVATAAELENARGLCVGRMKAGTLKSCNGVLVADDVEEGGYALGRREDGVLVMTYDTRSAQDVERVSRDRGVTWE